jgi:hypothetical protein
VESTGTTQVRDPPCLADQLVGRCERDEPGADLFGRGCLEEPNGGFRSPAGRDSASRAGVMIPALGVPAGDDCIEHVRRPAPVARKNGQHQRVPPRLEERGKVALVDPPTRRATGRASRAPRVCARTHSGLPGMNMQALGGLPCFERTARARRCADLEPTAPGGMQECP